MFVTNPQPTSALASLLGAAPALPPQGHSGPFGFLENLLGDVKDFGTGLGRLGSMAVHDIGRGVATVVPGQQQLGIFNDQSPEGFYTDNVVTGLPGAIAHDLSTRYGPLFQGHFSDFLHGVYQHPLSFITDALTVGGVAEKAATWGAKAALEGSGAAADIAKTTTEALASAGFKEAKQGGLRAGMEALAGERPLSPLENLARRILPAAEERGLGSRIVQELPSGNPVRRLLIEAPAKAILTSKLPTDALTTGLDLLEHPAGGVAAMLKGGISKTVHEIPVDQVQQRMGVLAADIKTSGMTAAKLNEFKDLQKLLTFDSQDVTRVYRPGVAAIKEKLATNRALGAMAADWLRTREGRVSAVQQALAPLKGDEVALAQSPGRFQRLNVQIEGMTPTNLAADLAVAQPTLVRMAHGGSSVLTKTLTDLTPEERAAADSGPLHELLASSDSVTADAAAAIAKQREHVSPENLTRYDDGANRYLASLRDPVRRGLAEMQGAAPDKVETAMESTRLAIAAQNEIPMLKISADSAAHLVTPEDILSRSYRPLMQKYGAELDQATGEWKGGPELAALDDTLRAHGISAPVYYPYIRPEDARLSDFLVPKSKYGMVASAKKSAGFLKRYEGKAIRSGNFVSDPIEAYVHRAAKGTRLEEAYRIAQGIGQQFGRQISSVDELMPGEAVFSPAGISRVFRTHMKLDDLLSKIEATGGDTSKGDELLADALHATVGRGQDELAAELAANKLYAVPRGVADTLDNLNKWHLGPNTRLFWDSPMNLWRTMVLTASPRWVVNNFLGNIVFGAMQGSRTRDAIAILENRLKQTLNAKLGWNLDTSLLDRVNAIDGIEKVGSGYSGSEYLPKLGRAGLGKTGVAIGGLKGSTVGQLGSRYSTFIKKVNGEIETAFRQASFAKGLERQMDPGAIRTVARSFWTSKMRMNSLAEHGFSDGEVTHALNEVNYFFGDYARLSPFERNIVRRFAFPFWGFYKHVGELLSTFPVEYPARAAVLQQITKLTEEMQQQYGPMPSWLKSAAPQFLPGAAGRVPFIGGAGPDPFSALSETPLAAMNPVAKVALEQWQGRSLLTDQPFTSPDVVTPFGTDQQFRIIRGPDGAPIGVEPIEKTTPGLAEHLLQQIPLYDQAKAALAGGSTYSTSTLLDALRGNATRTNSAGEVSAPTSPMEQFMKYLGLGTTNFDVGTYQTHLAEDQKAALALALKQFGLGV